MTLARGTDLRFRFGRNWLRYASTLREDHIRRAERLVRDLLEVASLDGRRFLDVGSGSGIFSLAARRLGAVVHSFDVDEESVECTRALKLKYAPDDPAWTVERGSVLDDDYLGALGTFDVVYSWGVLHHTGDLWAAMDNVAGLVGPGGRLCVAVYNDQGWASRLWRMVKLVYNVLPPRLRFVVFWPAFVRLWAPTLVRDALHGDPLKSWRMRARERGMSPGVDARDWVGGYPFAVATPAGVIDFCRARGFGLVRLVPRAGIGCNEFVFERRPTD